ncbi:MAG: helicase C-terminal domain-containing protein [Candidatus Sumerlaeia bacterium]|nr:helicase C-terminal domain-containing protein [Candidatus Sumerlaeia bacterium]
MLRPPIEGDSAHYFTAAAAAQVAAEIAEAGGVEVFFIGRRDATGLVAEVESHAYGGAHQVPALIQLAQPGEVIIHNHPGGELLPSDADLDVSARVGSIGAGSYIVDNGCARCRVVVRPEDPREKRALDPAEVLARLSAGSPLAEALGDFEDRPQQRQMAAAVADSFNRDGIAVVEAGTGTGKSLAYLVPAILYALRNKERIVVSTNTINLQEQLLHKDLPAVRAALGEEFTAELVKGRSNYVCKRKASYAREEAASLLDDEFRAELKELLEWTKASPTGDRGELPVPPRPEVWERVESEADNCLRVRCPFYEQCFYYSSRRRAARADVLIVNHSLLLSDLAVRAESGNFTTAAVLPPYKRVVIDEAHHLEEVATGYLAADVNRTGLRRAFARLYRLEGGARRGVLASFLDGLEKLVARRILNAADDFIVHMTMEVAPAIPDARGRCDQSFADFAEEFLLAQRLERPRKGLEHRLRLTDPMARAEAWAARCEPHLREILGTLADFASLMKSAMEQAKELPEDARKALVNPLLEWQAMAARIDGRRRTLAEFLRGGADACRWIELAQDPQQRLTVRLGTAPVEVADTLREALHDRMKSETLTSATLTVEGGFDFYLDRIGIRRDAPAPEPSDDPADGPPPPPVAERARTLRLESPFDYARQVFLGVPEDLGDPRSAEFDAKLSDLIVRASALTGGRAFFLFTSYGQLQRVHDRAAPALRRLGIEVLRQGTGGRDRLLRQFREDETSVLFATSSFWEGVDVKGRALELLVIAKLPFALPTDPLQEAQYEALQKRGIDPFDYLVVPRAIIRLKQGFGRLIRSRTDRGAVLIADNRVLKMGYGRRFLRSLPGAAPVGGPAADVLEKMRGFLGA